MDKRTGELLVKQSRGRHPNVYIIPYERCPACQGSNPKLALPVEINRDETNPQVDTPPTRNSRGANPKL
jgi:hypothetical protein